MIIDHLINRAMESKKTIVLTEVEDKRVLKASEEISKIGFADIILVGNTENIAKINMQEFDLSKVKIIDIQKSENLFEYINLLYELRKDKNITIEKAEKLLTEPIYFATMMLKTGSVDGIVSGALHSTADTIRPALQIIKARQDVKCISSFFIMETKKEDLGHFGKYIFADCGLIEKPTATELAEIAKSSAKSCREFLQVDPKVALLSYSTKGSANSELIDNVVEAVNILENEDVDFDFDGELQLDAAIIEEVAKLKAKESKVAGLANVLIFPCLEAGNIGYKLVQRFGDANAYGPILQGMAKPVNDLSRGCNVKDIIATVAITSIQAQGQ